jgi:hypothetical protein
VRSSKGSAFLLCARSLDDPAYVRYPRLPRRECAGFDAREPDPRADADHADASGDP